MKSLLLFLVLFFVSSCGIKIANLNDLWITSKNDEWSAFAQHFENYRIRAKNINYPDLEVWIYPKVREKSLILIMPLPIPFLYTVGDYENCSKWYTVSIYFSTPKLVKNEDKINFFKSNNVIFDTTKAYLIKDGKKYNNNVKLLNKNNKYLHVSDNYLKNKKYGVALNLGLGCKALDNTMLVVEGITVNGKELSPLMLELKYGKTRW